jgi:hypothetical protein
MSCFAIIEMTQDQGQVVARLIPDDVEQAGMPDTIALTDTPVQQSKGNPNAGSVAETVHRELAQRLGLKPLSQLIKNNKLVIASHAPDGTQGSYQNGVVTLYPDNIATGQAWAVFLHEAGEHAGLEQMLGDKYSSLVQRFNALVREKNPDALRAVERVPADTPPQHVASERLAYLIEDFTQQQTKTGKVKIFVQGLLATVRAWAFATLPKWLVGNMSLSPADIQALAVRAARAWADSVSAQNQGKMSRSAVSFSKQNEFEQTAQQYGGQAAWEQAQREGKTKLDYRQWVQVRTSSFKRWFGEWDNERETGNSENNVRGVRGLPTGNRSDVRRAWRLDPNTGEPRRYFHGTADTFTQFDLYHSNRKDTGWLGRGVYLSSDQRIAQSYANLKQGRDEPVVMEVFSNVRNPYIATLDDKKRGRLLSQESIDKETESLISQGYDGVVLPFSDGTFELVAFNPASVKSATDNIGSFAPDNPDIRYSKKASSEARESGLSASGDADLWSELKAQAPKEGMARNKELLGKGWQWTKDHIRDVAKTGGLGLLTLRQLAEVGAEVVPAVQRYMNLTERMLTERNKLLDEGGKLAERWTQLDKGTRQKLAFVMHRSTLERVDPSLESVAAAEVFIRVTDLEWRKKLGMERPASLLDEVEPERLVVDAKTLKLLQARYKEADNKAMRSRGNREHYEQLKQVAERLRGDWVAAKQAVYRQEQALKVFDRLHQQFMDLPLTAQQIFRDARDMYEARFARKHEALLASIQAAEMPNERKKAIRRALQQEFESAKLQGIYFPLHRSGSYFVRAQVRKKEPSETIYLKKASGYERVNRATGEVIQDSQVWDSADAALKAANSRIDLVGKDLIAVGHAGGWALKENPNEPIFLMYSTAAEAERVVARFKADAQYSDVNLGVLNKENTQDELGRAGVLMQTMTAMKKNNQDVPDEMYQLMLEMLPELSMRKSSIHRKGVLGYSDDALQAFAHQMMHQAHQISKLEARDPLAAAMSDVEEQAKHVPTEQRLLAGRVREELKKRHNWVMNPNNAVWTNWTSSFGFLMYLGVSPAAALVNLSQVAIVGYPALAAKYGWIEAAKALNATARQLNLREVVLGDDAISRMGLSVDELAAMNFWHDTGVIDKSQAQMLAGVADNDALSNSQAYQRAMGMVAHLFHKTEVVNREVMLLSAYRLARAKGEIHERAMQYASDVTWETQFDYSNANRARFMQNDFAKVALMFKSYSQHMIYFLLRNARQWGKGGADAKAARSKLLGILAVTLAMGGVSALPLGFVGAATGFAYAQAKFGTKMASIGTVGAVAGLMLLSAAVLDEEEDWESELRKALRSIGGEPLETLVFRGAVNLTTGVDLSSRISLDDLLMRESDRELEGADAKGALLEQLAGPVVGYGVNALYTVPELWSQDHEWRAAEKLAPKFFRDLMQTLRFSTEGALTMKGSPIVERDFLGRPYSDELNVWNLFWKANGFNAEKLTGQYVANNDFMNAKKRVQASREKVVNRLFVASVENDQNAILEAKKAIKDWNQAHPQAKQINEAAMKRSLAARLRARRENDHGVRVQAAEVYLRE